MTFSIKTRLLLSGLICALLTGFAGGVGIWSLNQIQDTVKKTTASVRKNISIQNRELIDVIELRKVAGNISNAKNIKELETYLPQLTKIHEKGRGEVNQNRFELIDAILNFFITKQNDFLTREKLDLLSSKNKAILDEITGLSYNISDNVEFDAEISISQASEQVVRDVVAGINSGGQLDESKNRILDSYRQMNEITDTGFKSLKAALTVTMGCKEVDALIKEIYLLKDTDLIKYLQTSVFRSLENIRQRLNELPDSSEGLQVKKDLAGFESNISQIIKVMLNWIGHEQKITAIAGEINRHLREIQQTTLSLTGQMVEKADRELDDNYNLITRWQKIELIIVAIAVVLAVFIAFGLSHSVSRQLNQLNKGIEIISKGNLDHRVDTRTQDELGQLSRAFDDMTNTLKMNMDDITRARKDAEQASIAKSEFLANMSHEIRTPMNGVMGMLEILLETKLSPEQKEFARLAQISADALLSLINDILDFSKIEAGKLDIENIDFNLRPTLENLSDVLAIKAYEKGIEFACLIEEDVPVYLNGDPSRLRQILTNLCGNAVKFVHKGAVDIQASVKQHKGDRVIILFEVSDTGIGIPEEKVSMLFNSFTQVDASITRKYGGTGLGLAISKQLSELMGGEIGVRSQEGVGSTFWFTIDFGVQEKPGLRAIMPSQDLKGIKVLVVDDNAINHKVFSEYLKSWGCRFKNVRNGRDAISALKKAHALKDPFQIVLLDMQMPEMTGKEAGRRIKADPDLKSTHVVIVSSVAERGDAAIFKTEGFSGFLTKPLKKHQIFDCLRTLLGTPEELLNDPVEPIISQYTFEDRNMIPEEKNGGLSLLLVEDNKINQKVVNSFLRKTSHKVTIANNGLEAVEIASQNTFDLILMDNQMPVMGGIEATEKIREMEKEKESKTPIVALTANAMLGDREKFIAAGMDDYISKPLKKQNLFRLIARYQAQINTGSKK